MTTTDRILQYCYHYDPRGSKYVLMATHVMQLGGALTLAIVGGVLGVLWWRELRKKRNDRGARVVPSSPRTTAGAAGTEEIV